MPQHLKKIFTNSFRKRYLVLCHCTVFFRFNKTNFSASNVKLLIYSVTVCFVKNMGIVVDDVKIGKDKISSTFSYSFF